MSENILDVNKIIVTRQNSSATSAAAPSSLDYGEVAVDINGVLRTGNKNKQVVTHVVSTDSRLTDTRNPKATQLSTENLNSITTPGFYYAGGNNTIVNKPSGVDAFGLLVERTAGGFFAQILTSANQMNGKIFFRQISSGTTWTAWSSFYTTTYKPTPAEIGAATASHTHSYLPLSGGTMTGAITLPGNPTANLHAATKQYVDSKIAASGGGDMLKSVYDTDGDGVVDKAEKLSGLTASRVLVTDSSGNSVVSAVTSTELGYLDGVTSSVQTQLNGKAASTHTHTKSQITDFPTSLKNPNAMKLQLNGGTTEGTSQFTYDGSAAKNINITPASIGAATSSHTHNYAGSNTPGGAATNAKVLESTVNDTLYTFPASEMQCIDINGNPNAYCLRSQYRSSDGQYHISAYRKYDNSQGKVYCDSAGQITSLAAGGTYYNFAASELQCLNVNNVPNAYALKSLYRDGRYLLQVYSKVDNSIQKTYCDYAGEIISASSIKYKDDIHSIKDELLDSILELDVIDFVYNEEAPQYCRDEKRHFGMIAEQVGEIMPDSVILNSENNPTAIVYSDFIPLLLAQLKRQNQQIKVLQEKIEKLETSNNLI